MRRFGRHRFFHLALGVLVVALPAGACSDDTSGSASDASAGGGDGDSAAVLGEPDPASGELFVVGTFIDRGGEAVDLQEIEIGRKVAAEYVNQYLGGIGVEGRPLELRFCETRNTAAGATECANGFVQEGVSAFVGGSSTVGGAVAGLASEAGVPYITTYGAATEELVSPGSFSLAGTTLAVLGAPAVYGQQEGLSRIGVLTIDVPTTTQALDAIAAPAYESAGLELDVVPVPPGTADMTANVASAPDAEAWLVLGDAAFCTTALQAIQTQAPDAVAFIVVPCVAPEVADKLPNGYENTLAVASTRLDPADPEFDVFEAVVDLYADQDVTDLSMDFIADGYISVVGFARLMEDYAGDGSAASVQEHLEGATGELPLSGGVEMTCGNSPIDFVPAFCSMSGWIISLDADGQPTDFEMVDVVPLFTD